MPLQNMADLAPLQTNGVFGETQVDTTQIDSASLTREFTAAPRRR